jgi:chromosome segregation ATPase
MVSNPMDALTVNSDGIDTLIDLEERITRAVQMISELRSENESLQGNLRRSEEQMKTLQTERDDANSLSEEFQKETVAAQEQVKRLNEELETLRDERKQVKSRIEKLLGQLDLLSGS